MDKNNVFPKLLLGLVRKIKKHLLPVLFWGIVWFGIIGLYVVINDMAALQHGYRCWGIEDIVFVGLVLYAIVEPLIKRVAKMQFFVKEQESKR